MYQDLYDICLNVEEVMQMFSKELQELDHNTVIYMIDELQDQLDEANATISEKNAAISMKDATIAELQLKIKALESRLSK
jgi:peptidoglycan hydrolase CwlO-like protein